MNFWAGKKTFILSALLIVYAISGFFTGHLTFEQALQIFGLGGIATTLRLAIK